MCALLFVCKGKCFFCEVGEDVCFDSYLFSQHGVFCLYQYSGLYDAEYSASPLVDDSRSHFLNLRCLFLDTGILSLAFRQSHIYS